MTAGTNSFKNATAHKANSYCTLAISYCTFCVGKHTILGPGFRTRQRDKQNHWRTEAWAAPIGQKVGAGR